jgi:hypothetical protein
VTDDLYTVHSERVHEIRDLLKHQPCQKLSGKHQSFIAFCSYHRSTKHQIRRDSSLRTTTAEATATQNALQDATSFGLVTRITYMETKSFQCSAKKRPRATSAFDTDKPIFYSVS